MSKTCFVISPVGEDNSQLRGWSDLVFNHVITPVVMELGYVKPLRADSIYHPGLISNEIMKHLVEDDLVVADLTDRNPNVYYELAIRHVLQKPVVHILKEGEHIPFDVSDIRVIAISLTLNSIRKVEFAKNALKSQIIFEEDQGTTIIPRIFQFRQINLDKDSHDGQKEELINLLEQLKNVRLSLGELKDELITINSRNSNSKL